MNSRQKLQVDITPLIKETKAIPNGDGNSLDTRQAVHNISGGNTFVPAMWWLNGQPGIYLNDGSIINIIAPANAYPQILVDTSGNKGPNKFGYDLFFWKLQGTKAIPESYDYGDGQDCALTNGTYSGVMCGKYAIVDKCPWDSTKGYWECLP